MIDGIGKSSTGRIDLRGAGARQDAAVAPVGETAASTRSGGVGGAMSELLSMGAPVDTDKVSAIREAIAQGRYSVDPDAIAERMIADLHA